MSYDLWMPLTAWSAPSALSFEVSTSGSGGWASVTIPTGTWGFGADDVNAEADSRVVWDASADSLAGTMRDAVETALSLTGIVAEYCTGSGATDLAWRIYHATQSIYVRAVTSGGMAKIGLYGAPNFRFRPANDALVTWSDRNWWTVFAPNCAAATWNPIADQLAEATENVFNPAVQQVTRFGQLNAVSVTWQLAQTRYVNKTFAAVPDIAGVAGTSVNDEYNTLEDLTHAGASGYALRLYLTNQSATPITALIRFQSNISQNEIAEETDQQRHYRITLTFIKT